MSKSLLVNVLDMEDNYKLGLGQPSFTASHTVPDIADVYRRRCSSNIIYGMIQKLRNPFLRQFSLGTPPFPLHNFLAG